MTTCPEHDCRKKHTNTHTHALILQSSKRKSGGREQRRHTATPSSSPSHVPFLESSSSSVGGLSAKQVQCSLLIGSIEETSRTLAWLQISWTAATKAKKGTWEWIEASTNVPIEDDWVCVCTCLCSLFVVFPFSVHSLSVSSRQRSRRTFG